MKKDTILTIKTIAFLTIAVATGPVLYGLMKVIGLIALNMQ